MCSIVNFEAFFGEVIHIYRYGISPFVIGKLFKNKNFPHFRLGINLESGMLI